MTLPFPHIPDNFRLPGAFVDFDPSQANTASFPQRALLIAAKTSAGNGVADQAVLLASLDDAKAKGGPGSLLAQMMDFYRRNDPTGEVWGGIVADAGGGVAASGSVKFTSVATAPGTLNLYVHGERVQMAVSASQTLAQLATALIAAINANTDLGVTALVNGGDATQVDITSKHKGLQGNDIDLQLNYLGAAGGEATPTGLAVTITAMSGGTTNPTLTTLLANLSDAPFDFIAMPWNDATSLDALKTFMDDNSGRWSYVQQLYGHFVVAYKNSYANVASLGAGRNDPAGSVMGFTGSPSPTWAWAAALNGQAAVCDRADHGQPIKDVPLVGIKAPPAASRFTKTQRNSLLFTGISTFTVGSDGTVFVERLITTYQKNAQSQPDTSYLNSETRFLLQFVTRQFINLVSTKYGRKKLAAEGSIVPPNGNVIVPSTLESDFIALHRELEEQGFTQRSEEFAKLIKGQVVQNASNPSKVDALLPIFLAGQLFTTAMLVQFRLS